MKRTTPLSKTHLGNAGLSRKRRVNKCEKCPRLVMNLFGGLCLECDRRYRKRVEEAG